MTRGEMKDALHDAEKRLASVRGQAATDFEADICDALELMHQVLVALLGPVSRDEE